MPPKTLQMDIMQKLTHPSLSIILPCHNEQDSISYVLDKLLSSKTWMLENTDIKSIEIIVVDDGSSDQSLSAINDYRNQIKLVQLSHNHGYGQALKAGFRVAKSSYLCFYDLDKTCSSDDIWPLFQAMIDSNSGMILGNRLSKSSQMPLQRYLGNRIYRDLTSLLVGKKISDCCTGFRIFHRRYLKLFCEPLPGNLNYSLAMTITFLRAGGVISEKPIFYGEREGKSKLNALVDGPRFLFTLLNYALSPKYSFGKLHGLIE